ncbi:unnamed protein product [Lota lota]
MPLEEADVSLGPRASEQPSEVESHHICTAAQQPRYILGARACGSCETPPCASRANAPRSALCRPRPRRNGQGKQASVAPRALETASIPPAKISATMTTSAATTTSLVPNSRREPLAVLTCPPGPRIQRKQWQPDSHDDQARHGVKIAKPTWASKETTRMLSKGEGKSAGGCGAGEEDTTRMGEERSGRRDKNARTPHLPTTRARGARAFEVIRARLSRCTAQKQQTDGRSALAPAGPL